jgi:hypothetical protein
MRNMSFMLTTTQVREGTKTVTRRPGWWFLKPGDRLMACVKCQGLGKGGTIEKIREIEVVSTKREPLSDIEDYDNDHGRAECVREGFPGMMGYGFMTMFLRHMGWDSTDTQNEVNRIEFKYVTDAPLPPTPPSRKDVK